MRVLRLKEERAQTIPHRRRAMQTFPPPSGRKCSSDDEISRQPTWCTPAAARISYSTARIAGERRRFGRRFGEAPGEIWAKSEMDDADRTSPEI
jgi:hypothetical protein